MLLIESELRQSDIHGVGLFCIKPIPKGTKVWEFHPLFDLKITDTELVALPPAARTFLRMYGYRSLETGEYILGADLSRHMNHADTPSLYSDSESNYYAAYDLEPYTELTCDYRAFSLEGCSDFLDEEQRKLTA